MKYQPGQSGNPAGRKAQKIWRDAIAAAMREHTGSDQTEAMKKVAMKLVCAAMKEDVSALREIGDRIDGKAVQQVDITNTSALDELTLSQLADLADAIRQSSTEPSSTGDRAKDAGVQAGTVPPLH